MQGIVLGLSQVLSQVRSRSEAGHQSFLRSATACTPRIQGHRSGQGVWVGSSAFEYRV